MKTFFKNLFTRDKWHSVKILNYSFNTWKPGNTESEKEHKVFFHLYESLKGKRKVKIVITNNKGREEFTSKLTKESDIYQTKIQPWLDGRYDPEIPTYNDIPKEDMINKLKA